LNIKIKILNMVQLNIAPRENNWNNSTSELPRDFQFQSLFCPTAVLNPSPAHHTEAAPRPKTRSLQGIGEKLNVNEIAKNKGGVLFQNHTATAVIDDSQRGVSFTVNTGLIRQGESVARRAKIIF
jgi:hypothetical protein